MTPCDSTKRSSNPASASSLLLPPSPFLPLSLPLLVLVVAAAAAAAAAAACCASARGGRVRRGRPALWSCSSCCCWLGAWACDCAGGLVLGVGVGASSPSAAAAAAAMGAGCCACVRARVRVWSSRVEPARKIVCVWRSDNERDLFCQCTSACVPSKEEDDRQTHTHTHRLPKRRALWWLFWRQIHMVRRDGPIDPSVPAESIWKDGEQIEGVLLVSAGPLPHRFRCPSSSSSPPPPASSSHPSDRSAGRGRIDGTWCVCVGCVVCVTHHHPTHTTIDLDHSMSDDPPCHADQQPSWNNSHAPKQKSTQTPTAA
jgi:hypothetical protein